MSVEPSPHSATLATKEAFNDFVAEVQARKDYKKPLAFALGFATIAGDGSILDVYYPAVNMTIDGALENPGSAAIFADAVGHLDGSASYRINFGQTNVLVARFAAFDSDGKTHANIKAVKLAQKIEVQGNKKSRKPIITFIADDGAGPKSTADAYLRLQLLSQRKVLPHKINLDGIFGSLPIVAWTSEGPLHPDEVEDKRAALMIDGKELFVFSLDKFPPMLNYTIPGGVRIADGARVRLGACLGPGTTVMHEGFVNMNAGTAGPAMVEGRISAGVYVMMNSDIGGGASIMGTLSGGGNQIITIGENCLLGANAGTGISLGDRCTIEAGLYVTDKCKVYVVSDKHLDALKAQDAKFESPGEGHCIKAIMLSGMDDMLFIRNSRNGRIELRFNQHPNKLNAALHAPAPAPTTTP